MTKSEILKESIVKITKHAGMEMSGRFHLTPVSRDSGGIFIMEVMSPDRKRLCEEVKRAVKGFPSDTQSSCIVLLPEVVDGIIVAAQSGPTDFHRASGRTVAGEAPMDAHCTGDENVPRM